MASDQQELSVILNSVFAMENLRVARMVDNATNQRGIVPCDQDNGTVGECGACGYVSNRKSGPLSNWGAFPAGVKFDPSDEELLHHLRAENKVGNVNSHPLIKSFISVLEGEDGICQTHPEKLPGVKMDGSSKHFFHRPAKAYTTGTRKRRKIHCDDDPGVETRWHKTGKTRPVTENGQPLGWKKIMVLYRNTGPKKSKPEKTNWILHQYHLGQSEEETDGELVVCKVFYQKQPRQCTGGRAAEGHSEVENFDLNQGTKDVSGTCISEVSREPPVTPKVDEPRPRPTRPEPLGRGDAITQSSKNSELTAICMDTPAPVASGLTSAHKNETLGPSARTHSLVTGEQMIYPVVQNLKPGPPGHGTKEWSDEASTADQAENDNAPRGADGDEFPFRGADEYPGLRTGSLGLESQPVFPDDHEIDLFCPEDIEMLWHVEHNFGNFEELGISNPNEDYPAVDYNLDSLPELNADLLLSSQEAQDVLNHLRPCAHLDNDDSLSST